jgi:hypothetical protein
MLFFLEACKPCEKGFYCVDGKRTGCQAGWTTATTASSSPAQCNVCEGCVSTGGMFCNTANANMLNAACSECQPGYFCPSTGGALLPSQPTPCTAGFACPESRCVEFVFSGKCMVP